MCDCVHDPPNAQLFSNFFLFSQASVLLSSPKYSMDDFKFVSFISLLNSGQVTLLLENYQLEEGEPPLSPDFARRLIDCAKMQCDKVCCLSVHAYVCVCARVCVCPPVCLSVCVWLLMRGSVHS